MKANYPNQSIKMCKQSLFSTKINKWEKLINYYTLYIYKDFVLNWIS